MDLSRTLRRHGGGGGGLPPPSFYLLVCLFACQLQRSVMAMIILPTPLWMFFLNKIWNRKQKCVGVPHPPLGDFFRKLAQICLASPAVARHPPPPPQANTLAPPLDLSICNPSFIFVLFKLNLSAISSLPFNLWQLNQHLQIRRYVWIYIFMELMTQFDKIVCYKIQCLTLVYKLMMRCVPYGFMSFAALQILYNGICFMILIMYGIKLMFIHFILPLLDVWSTHKLFSSQSVFIFLSGNVCVILLRQV